jgi:hypothetical protein
MYERMWKEQSSKKCWNNLMALGVLQSPYSRRGMRLEVELSHIALVELEAARRALAQTSLNSVRETQQHKR